MNTVNPEQFDDLLDHARTFEDAGVRLAVAQQAFAKKRDAPTYHEWQDAVTNLKETWRILKGEMRRLDQLKHI